MLLFKKINQIFSKVKEISCFNLFEKKKKKKKKKKTLLTLISIGIDTVYVIDRTSSSWHATYTLEYDTQMTIEDLKKTAITEIMNSNYISEKSHIQLKKTRLRRFFFFFSSKKKKMKIENS